MGIIPSLTSNTEDAPRSYFIGSRLGMRGTILVLAVLSALMAIAYAGSWNRGEHCWFQCGKNRGPCSWCGGKSDSGTRVIQGACCRRGWSGNGCDGRRGGRNRHECTYTDDCWNPCDKKEGRCDGFCGEEKLCCRMGWRRDGCNGHVGGVNYHKCVLKPLLLHDAWQANLRIKNNNQKGCNQNIYHEKERDIETKKECEEAAKFLEIRARAWGLVSSNQQKIWKYQTTSGPTAIVARSNNNPSSCFYKIDEYQKATLYFNANGLGTRGHWRGECTINEPCICKKILQGEVGEVA